MQSAAPSSAQADVAVAASTTATDPVPTTTAATPSAATAAAPAVNTPPAAGAAAPSTATHAAAADTAAAGVAAAAHPAVVLVSPCPWCGEPWDPRHYCEWWDTVFEHWGAKDDVPDVAPLADPDVPRTVERWMAVLAGLIDEFRLTKAEVEDFDKRATYVATKVGLHAAKAVDEPVHLVLMDGKGVMTFLILKKLKEFGVPLDRVVVHLIDVDKRMHAYHETVLPSDFDCHNWDVCTWLNHVKDNLPNAVVYFNFSKLALGITEANAAPGNCRGLMKTLNDAGAQLNNVCAFANSSPSSTVIVSFPTVRGTGKDADGVSHQDRLFQTALETNGKTSTQVWRRGAKFVTFHVM